MPTQVQKYRVNPHLLIYPRAIEKQRNIVAEVSCDRSPLVLKNPHFTYWLSALPSEFDYDSAQDLWTDIAADTGLFEAVWGLMLDQKILVSNDNSDISLRKFKLWEKYQWAEAALYHQATVDYPFMKMDEKDSFDKDEADMRAFVNEASPPPIYQLFDNKIKSVPLKKHENTLELENYVTSLTKEEANGYEGLSVILDICFGERGQEVFGCQGKFLRKTIPSGGARHPLEMFYFSFSDSFLEPGLYHYNVKDNALDMLKSGQYYKETQDITFDLFKKFPTQPSGLLVFTVLPERAMWRYRDNRSYRAILIDVGHALGSFRMVSEKLGYEHYTYQKFKDSDLADLIGIDLANQLPLFTATLVK